MSGRLTNPAVAGLAGLLVAYGALLVALIGAVPGGSDNSGYFNEARLLARGEFRATIRSLPGLPAHEAPPYLYIPLGFKPSSPGAATMVPTYSPGLPLLLVPAARLVGWRNAGDLVLILHSLAGIALTFALGRRCGLPAAWALLAAAALAASPLYLFTSLQALSDVPATAWATAAVLAALAARERAGWAWAAGACVGVAFLVRPNNFLVGLPVALALGASPRRLLAAAAGALPSLAAWMAINHAAYGSALESGYGAIGAEFHAALVPSTLAFCAVWMPMLLGPVILAGPFLVLARRGRTRVTWVLLAWSAAFIAFFLPYRWTHEAWWFLRFLLPAAPALIVAGLIAAHEWVEGVGDRLRGVSHRVLPALLALATVGVEASQGGPLGEAWTIGHGERKYGRVAEWLRAHAPAEAALVAVQASGALFYYLDNTVVRWDQITPGNAARVEAAVAGRPLFAALFPFERPALETLPGKWVRVGNVEDVTLWRRDPR